MSRNWLIGLVAIALWGGMSHAQAEMKVGVVNFQRLFEEAPQAQAARQVLEKKFGPRQKELADAQKKAKDMEDKMGRDAAIMSESERAKMERDLMAQKRELKRMQEEFGDDFNFERGSALETIQRTLVESVRAFAAEKKFDLILSDGVVYASDALDITEQVMERLKKDTSKAKPGGK